MDFEEWINRIKRPQEKFDAALRKLTRVALIVACAYVAASVVSTWCVSAMMDGAATKGRVRPTTVTQVSLDFERINYRDLRKSIMNRNIFNADGEVPDETVTEDEQDSMSTSSDFDMSAACAKSALNLELKGTIYVERGEGSIATVQESGYSETDIYREGDSIIGQEGATIVKIERQRVVINNNGKKECIELAKDSKLANSGYSPPAPVATSESKPSGGEGANSGGAVTLDEQYVQKELGEGYNKIITKARLVPNTTNNQMNGFKIFAIDKKSLLNRIGLRNNDIITKVNDTSLKQPEQGFALYQALQNEREVRIELMRGSKPQTLNVLVK